VREAGGRSFLFQHKLNQKGPSPSVSPKGSAHDLIDDEDG